MTTELHDDDRHYLLAPDDIPAHLTADHAASPIPPQSAFPARQVEVLLQEWGIKSTGDPTIDRALAWHEHIHVTAEAVRATDAIEDLAAALAALDVHPKAKQLSYQEQARFILGYMFGDAR